MSKELRVQAFTHDSDIFFNEGRFNPDTSSCKELLAHELTHVIQQGHAKNKAEIGGKKVATPEKTTTSEAKEETETKATEPPEAVNKAEMIGITELPVISQSGEKASEAEPGEKAKTEKVGVEVKAKQEKTVPEAEEPEPAEKAGKERAKSAGGSGNGAAEAAPVEPLSMEGPSDKALESLTTASVSQVAASFPSLGTTLSDKLSNEHKEEAANAPVSKVAMGS